MEATLDEMAAGEVFPRPCGIPEVQVVADRNCSKMFSKER